MAGPLSQLYAPDICEVQKQGNNHDVADGDGELQY